MNIVKREPFFDFFYNWIDYEKSSIDPQIKITKNEEGYKLFMILPGLTKEDINVSIKDRLIKISHRKQEKTDSSQFVQSFIKEYVLPDNINESSIEAKLENGILEIKFPFEKKKITERLIELM